MPFAYRGYEVAASPADKSEIVWRPALRVLVGGQAAQVPLWGLVDTGAGECILPQEVADAVKPTPCAGTSYLKGFGGKLKKVGYGKVNLKIQVDLNVFQ